MDRQFIAAACDKKWAIVYDYRVFLELALYKEFTAACSYYDVICKCKSHYGTKHARCITVHLGRMVCLARENWVNQISFTVYAHKMSN